MVFGNLFKRSDIKYEYKEAKRLYELGMEAALRFESSKALEYYSMSIKLNPNPAPYINRANILSKRMRHKEALSDLLEAQRLDSVQAGEFNSVISKEIAQEKLFTANYENGTREKLLTDLKQNDASYVALRILCVAFGIKESQWSIGAFNRELLEFHFFNELDNVRKFDEISSYPEIEEYLHIYEPKFIELKIENCPDPNGYKNAETIMHTFLCSYDERDMVHLRRSMLYHLHEHLLLIDYGLESHRGSGIIKEAEDFIS